LASATVAGRIPGMPTSLTPLIGRQDEVAEVCAFLRRANVRLLTLTGPGGVGKTRLALSVVEAIAGDFPDGVVFVPVATIADPALLLPAIGRPLDVRESLDRPVCDRIIDALRHQRRLLVLDNLEQLIAAAPDIGSLVDACPYLKILVTSRVPLRLTGEQEFAVPPLDRAAAVALFVERARAVRHDFAPTDESLATVAAVCVRLDRLPLAIELAAARTKMLSPEAVLVRLSHRLRLLTGGPRDVPVRLQTMRDALAWSYDLLTPQEQCLFRRLAVFVGGFTFDAAEAVCGQWTDVSRQTTADFAHAVCRLPTVDSVLDGLTSLINGSLLVADDVDAPGARFHMLETVRAFALEILTASGEEAAVRNAHAAFVVGVAEPPPCPCIYVMGDVEQNWVRGLHPERDNLRSAFDWLEHTGDAASLVRLAAAHWSYGVSKGLVVEERDRLQRALAAADAHPAGVDLGRRALALMGLGVFAVGALEFERGLSLLAESRRLFEELGDKENSVGALVFHGIGVSDSGELERSLPLFEEALRRAGDGIDPHLRPWVLRPFGLAVGRAGDLARGRTLLTEAVSAYRALGDASNLTTAMRYLGDLARAQGDVRLATATLLESILTEGRDPTPWHLAGAIESLATIACRSGGAAMAARLFGASEVIRERSGVPIRPPQRPAYLHAVGELRAMLGEAGLAVVWGEGRRLSADEAIAAATTVAALVEAATTPPAPADRHGLTDRELDVLRLIAEGKSNREIADALGIQMVTAKTHVLHILAKLGVDSRVTAAVFAHRQGLV
jgi:predicted ATPase/DNA-binding CsgD family transcriptional regulator